MRNMTKRRRALMASSEPNGRLPHGYKEVEWLRGTGTQYCVTDVYPVFVLNGNFTSIKGDVTILDKQNSLFAIGARWTQTVSGTTYNYEYSTYFTTSRFRFRYGRDAADSYVNLNNYVFPLDVHYEINRENLVFNNNTLSRQSNIAYNSTEPLVIGLQSMNDQTPVNTQANVKAFSIYNNSTLLYQFVPCYRESDNKTGFMKITVADGSTEFFPNMGADEWIIGPIV